MVTSESRPASPPADSKSQWSGHLEDVENPAVDLLSLSRAVKARKAEYTRRRTIRVKVGTWNVAAISGTEKDIGKWFVQGQGMCEKLSGSKDPHSAKKAKGGSAGDEGNSKEDGTTAKPFQYSPEEVDLYVLGLQEIVDVSSPAEALRPYTDSGPSTRWKEAVHRALPPGYQLVSDVQLTGLLLLIYASPAIAESVSSISSASVGTGLMGYMGNKGAVATRLVLGETTRLVFVNCHLAAGSDKGSLERRNWDASQIANRAKFDAVNPEHGLTDLNETIGDEDFTFWFGDLNYRLDDIPGDDVRQVLLRHTANAYDDKRQDQQKSENRRDSHHSGSSKSSSASSVTEEDEIPDPVSDEEVDPRSDPASLQTTISSLIVHDQLRAQKQKGAAFHKGWREGEISFLPTYKYDVGSVAMFDSSEKHRGPSWCDRILYRTRRDKFKHEQLDREAEEVRKRDKEMQARGFDKAVADDSILFDYDPEVDGVDGAAGSEEYDPDDERDEEASLSSDNPSEDLVRLHRYVSHQGILTSDHKPLDAVFSLTFDAVNVSLKSKVHQEVVRELDKAENEARPGLTVVVDTHGEETRPEQDPNTVDFGGVPFDVPVYRSLTIANTSGAAATFSFAERSGRDGEVKSQPPSWLNVHVERPTEGEAHEEAPASWGRHTLLPGEVANVHAIAHVRNVEHVRLLNLKKVKLEDILVLRVDSGRDHFITVVGQWLPTCFGCSLDELTRMPEAGARSLANNGLTPFTQGGDEVRLSAPRELFRLTESISELTERAVAEWSMTKGDSGEEAPWSTDPYGTSWPFQPDTWTLQDPRKRAPLLASIRESLDTNQSLSSIFAPEIPPLHRLELLCETLLTFLKSLSDGIITAAVWQQMEQQMVAREKAKAQPRSWEETQAWVLESLAYSPAHSVSFTFVTFMLARVANEVAPVPSTAHPTTSSKHPKHASKKHPPGQEADKPPSTEPETPSLQPPTPASAAAFISAGSFRRKASLSESATTQGHPAAASRQAVEAALASLFTHVLISVDVPVPLKEKERRASEERKRSIIEPFLKMIAVDERGPSGSGA